jgi:hypothetical protein
MADNEYATPVTSDTNAAGIGDGGQGMAALSGAAPQAPPAPASSSLPISQQNPDNTAPFNQPQTQAAPVPAKQPSKWERVLMGMITGLAGGMGAKNFGQGLAGGAKASLDYAQQKTENSQRQQQIDTQNQVAQSSIKFQSAQAASLAADAALKDQQLHNLPQQQQDIHTANALGQMKEMTAMGLTPTIVADNHATGAKAGLQQLTDSHGGVPPMFTINLGDKIVGFDLNQLSQAPQALAQVNKIRQVTGQQPIDSQTWAQMPPELKATQTNSAFSFYNPMPSEQNLQVYTNYLNTAKAAPESPDKADAVAKLQNIVTGMKSGLDSANKRSNQQDVNKINSETPALAARAGAIAGADATARNRADAAAMGGNTDILGYQVPQTPGGVKEYNKRQDAFKKNADSLTQTDATFSQFNSILNDINSGKDMTGAQSVVGLFNAIGLSAEPLKGKGFRINNNTVEEHANARGLGESLYQKFLKLKSGDVITPQQLKDYATIAVQARHDAYVGAVNQAHNNGLKADFLLPQGNGKKIDDNTLQIFMSLTGNDPNKAVAAAKSKGWK